MKNTVKNKRAVYKSTDKPALCGSQKGMLSFALAIFANAFDGSAADKDSTAFCSKLERDFRQQHFLYIRLSIPIKDVYGNAQNPYMIINPNIEDMQCLFASYNCESFVFAVKNRSAESMEYQYWEKKYTSGSYKLSRENDSVSSLEEVNIFFRNLTPFNFVLGSSFDSSLTGLIAPYVENDGYYEKLHEQVYSTFKTAKHRRIQRYFMYETATQKQNRMQSLIDSHKKETAGRFVCAGDILVVRARSYAKRIQAESIRSNADF